MMYELRERTFEITYKNRDNTKEGCRFNVVETKLIKVYADKEVWI